MRGFALETLRALALGRQLPLRLGKRLALGVERDLKPATETPLVLESGLRAAELGAQPVQLVFRAGRLEVGRVAIEATSAGVGDGPGHRMPRHAIQPRGRARRRPGAAEALGPRQLTLDNGTQELGHRGVAAHAHAAVLIGLDPGLQAAFAGKLVEIRAGQ